jgi:hypothetical protein
MSIDQGTSTDDDALAVRVRLDLGERPILEGASESAIVGNPGHILKNQLLRKHGHQLPGEVMGHGADEVHLADFVWVRDGCAFSAEQDSKFLQLSNRETVYVDHVLSFLLGCLSKSCPAPRLRQCAAPGVHGAGNRRAARELAGAA